MSAAQNRKADASAALRQERLLFDSFRYAFCKISAIRKQPAGNIGRFRLSGTKGGGVHQAERGLITRDRGGMI